MLLEKSFLEIWNVLCPSIPKKKSFESSTENKKILIYPILFYPGGKFGSQDSLTLTLLNARVKHFPIKTSF